MVRELLVGEVSRNDSLLDEETAVRIIGKSGVVGHAAIVKLQSAPSVLLVRTVVQRIHPVLVGREEELDPVVVVDGSIETCLTIGEHVPVTLGMSPAVKFLEVIDKPLPAILGSLIELRLAVSHRIVVLTV